MKVLLIGLLLASPPVAAWMLRGDETALQVTEFQSVSPKARRPKVDTMQIPVEIVEKGTASKIVLVKLPNQAIPEPGVMSLVAVTSLLLLRRRRSDGK